MTPARLRQNFLREEPKDTLDSDSSEDEETEELCTFWHNLRRLQVKAILASSNESVAKSAAGAATAAAAASETPSAQRRPERASTWVQDATSSPSHPARPTTPACRSPVKRNTAELLRREAREARHATWSGPSRALAPGESPPIRGCRGSYPTALGLWRCPAEVTLQVLCFIQAYDVYELILTCKTTRAACSIHTSAGWFLVLPHLILSANAKIASAQLKRVWLPHTLWLEGRDLDSAACQALLRGLECTGAKAARALLTLDLRNTKNCSPTSVVSVARSCRSLRSLNLSRTRLRDLGASHLLSGLVFDPLTGCCTPHSTLRVLALEDNRLTAAVGKELARLVQETPLEVLQLACNQLGDEGTEAIAAALAGEAEDDCQLHLSPADIAARVSLTRLDISRNQVGSKGFAAIVAGLGVNRTLRSLEMGGNEDIGPGIAASSECAGCIASGLMVAKGLEELHLWKCGLADAGYNLIAESLPPNIAVANLATNNFSSTVRTFIMEARCGVIRL